MQLQSLVKFWGFSKEQQAVVDGSVASETDTFDANDSVTREGSSTASMGSASASLALSKDLYKLETRFGSGLSAVVHVASALSDNVFMFDLNSAHQSQQNVTQLQVSDGAASIVSGALATGSDVSVVLTSQVLPWFLANIFEYSASNQSIVFHVACETLDQNFALTSSHEILYTLQSSGAILLNSSDVEELHDLALVAHLAAKSLRKPVLHFYDGVHVLQQHTKLSLLTTHALAAFGSQECNDDDAGSNGFDDNAAVEIQQLMTSLAPVLGRKYALYEYYGSPDASDVVIVVGEATLGLQSALVHEQMLGASVGLLQLRSVSNLNNPLFENVLPSTVERIAVLENISFNAWSNQQIVLTQLVQSFVHSQTHGFTTLPLVITGIYETGFLFSEAHGQSVFRHLRTAASTRPFVVVGPTSTDVTATLTPTVEFDIVHATPNKPAEALDFAKTLRLWSLATPTKPENSLQADFERVLSLLALNPNLQLRTLTRESAVSEDQVNHPMRTLDIDLSLKSNQANPSRVLDEAHLGFVLDAEILEQYDVSQGIRSDGKLLVNASWDSLDQGEVSDVVKTKLAKKRIRVILVDAVGMESQFKQQVEIARLVLPVTFLKASGVYNQETVAELLKNQLDTNLHSAIDSLVSSVWASTREIDLGKTNTPPSSEDNDNTFHSVSYAITSALDRYSASSHGHRVSKRRRTVSEATKTAWRLFFPEAYDTKVHVRDQVTSLVQVTKWKRLTPMEYSRNVFHMEMDIANTPIKYSIGEALAVFAHNDHKQVLQFLSLYNLDPDQVVTLPVQKRFHKQPNASETETLTYFQLFAQVLDIFGRPSKKFYEALAQFARDEGQKEALLGLLTAEGKEAYKLRVDETTTFADLLVEFDSARPPIDELIAMVPRIKPRHYSIASSMKMHPNSVHLLVVLHDWTTPSGKYCIGQATRYLSTIQEGSWLSVSVCSSVMKLPVQPSDPVIMAGLGTGMAPFRAFLQERAFLKAAGHQVGPMALYFGSRHKAKEFLYGDELEQYEADGVLTYLRCAFSRDQKHKIYIQDRIAQDTSLLFDLLWNHNGHFYLCGPTWPVADVRDALMQSFTQQKNATRAQASAAIEKLREEGRYVLEVY